MSFSRPLSLLGTALSLFAVVAMAAPATSTSSGLVAPIANYTVTELTWSLEVDPKNKPGVKTLFNGTIENAVAQAIKVNPNFLEHQGIKLDHHGVKPADLTESTGADPADLTAKKFEEPPKWFCHGKWGLAKFSAIRDGVDYLNGLSGEPHLGPGPASCSRVSCSYQSAIWWCNDVRINLSVVK